MRWDVGHQRVVARVVVASWVGMLVACASVPGTDRGDTSDAPREYYAHRFAPPSVGWTTESAIPERRQGIWEVSSFAPGTETTPEQRAAADDLVRRCYEAALRHGWHDIEKAKADGFARPKHDPTHYRNDEFKLDDRILDPDRLENLMYYNQNASAGDRV